MKEKKRDVLNKILLTAFALLLMVMSFTGFVNYMTFVSHYNNALVTAYSTAGNEIVRKIEYAVGYGKPIDNYYGMQDTLRQLQELIPELEQVSIVTPQGKVLYDLNGFVEDRFLPDQLLEEAGDRQGLEAESSSLQFYQGKAYIFNDISSSAQNSSGRIALLAMVFPENTFLQFDSFLTRQLGAWLAGVAATALAVLLLIFFKTRILEKDGLTNKRVLMTLIVVIGGAQLCYTGINYFLFKNAYTDMVDTSRNFVQSITVKNIESIYAKGLTLENITGVDEYFASIKEGLPQIAEIGIVPSDSDSRIPAVKVSVADDYVQEQIFKVLLDMLTVLLISVFFMVEISLLAVSPLRIGKNSRDGPQSPDLRSGHARIRSLIFFVNLCAYMSVTFVPIVMRNLYQPVWRLTKEVVLALPLSAEMMGGVFAIFLASLAMRRYGWRSAFYTGIILLALGNVLAGLAENQFLFIVSRGIAGLGLGHILMAVRSLAVSLPEPSVAVAAFSAGSIAGMSCSLVIGGMLADRIGYEAVFYCAAVLAVIPFVFARRFMTGFEILRKAESSLSAGVKFTKVFTNKKTLMFLICIFIPYFVSGAFLDYYFPLFASAQGLSQSDISRGFLLNGLFIIYLGPFLTGYVTRRFSGIQGMVISMVIVISALTTFVIFGNVWGALVTIALLGLAESFGVSLKTTYFLNLPGIKDLEINKGIAYFSGMVNAGRIAGPMVYGLALSLGMRMGIGMIILGLTILLLVFGFSEKYKAEYSESRGIQA